MSSQLKKNLIVFLILLSSFLTLFIFLNSRKKFENSLDLNHKIIDNNSNQKNKISRNENFQHDQEPTAMPTKPDSKNLPTFFINETPFIPQAPFKIWDELHEEACEEAAILTAYYFSKNRSDLKMETIEKEIQALVAFQIKTLGKHKDLNVSEIAKLAEDFYQLKLTVLDNPTIKQLKEILSEKKIILVPTAGQVLANPNYTAPGPLYHAIVIIGYDDGTGQFITHDPGTRNGEKYHYSYQHLVDSIHDFPGKKENILQGAKRVLVTEPN